jgi:hypothetical protein
VLLERGTEAHSEPHTAAEKDFASLSLVVGPAYGSGVLVRDKDLGTGVGQGTARFGVPVVAGAWYQSAEKQ